MPIYSFNCPQCGEQKDDLRKLGEDSPPVCSCGVQMERFYTPVSAIYKGRGWQNGTWEKLNKRSESQSEKFFRRHPGMREMAKNKIQEKRHLEGG